MLLPQFFDNPFQVRLSFHKIIERLEYIATIQSHYFGMDIKALLAEINAIPELRAGIDDISQIKDNAGLISRMLSELFPAPLTLNEIKAVTIPYQGLTFNYTERFRKIIDAAGIAFDMTIRDFDDHQFYVGSCCLILNQLYGTGVDFDKPLFYDIPSANGILKHYRITYNADFMEVIPTEKAIPLTPEDIKLLLDNYDDLALWKAKFPHDSYILKGFGLVTLFDVTTENAVSTLKTDLLANADAPELQHTLETVFRSIFRSPDIRVGFTAFQKDEGKFSSLIMGRRVQSFLLPDKDEDSCGKVFSKETYDKLIKHKDNIALADLSEFVRQNPDNYTAVKLQEQGIRSLILAPLIKNDTPMGIIELVSSKANEFNSVNVHKLEIVMPFLVDTVDRKITDFQNKIEAVIQNNYTTLHPSVNWKFRREAKNFIINSNLGLAYTLKEIKFSNVYPLYGEVDIKNSSITRNLSVKNDLKNQLDSLMLLLEPLRQTGQIILAEQNLYDLREFIDDLESGIKADTEQNIQHYLEIHIYPLLKQGGIGTELAVGINNYFSQIDQVTGEFYANRRNYEKTLSLVNEKLVSILDSRQAEIQEFFPHYYERFKTDGVEHNLYIGTNISPENNFETADLERLRLWQLLVTAEMEIEQHRLKDILPYHLDVTSLILVFSSTIAIRFRMDEKHFDIDGAYNIRYEVIKKRIDKAHIKGTRDRITREGAITIVYTKAEEEAEYLRYIGILQSAGFLRDNLEHFDVEDLQGVSGLKALRVRVSYDSRSFLSDSFSYTEVYKQLQTK
jgi:hypothetical protein